MPLVTLQVLEGRARGRIYRELPTPITLGREEGCLVQLDDERVSRYHAKIQADGDQAVLVDLDSTNGTRINGRTIQVSELRAGDRIEMGTSSLLFGSETQINERLADLAPPRNIHPESETESNLRDLSPQVSATRCDDLVVFGQHALPPMPARLSPSQAARTSELLELLHQLVTQATDIIKADEDSSVTLSSDQWQTILNAKKALAWYSLALERNNAREP